MSREERLFVEDIRDCCEKVLRYTNGLDAEQLFEDEILFDAVMRNLNVIGEAAKHVSPDLRSRHPQIGWRKIIGLRNIVTHVYFGLDEDILWDIIQHSVPALLEQINQILKTEFGQGDDR